MSRPTMGFIVPLALVLLAGCAGRDTALSRGVDNPCATVQALVADYPEGFESFRGKANNTRTITTYRATEDLVTGHCEIWQWGNGDTAYTCSATAPSADVAMERYLNTVNFLVQCLGPDWSTVEMTRDRDADVDGQLTRFTSEEQPGLSLSAHLLDQKRGPTRSYSNYLYLGTVARDQ